MTRVNLILVVAGVGLAAGGCSTSGPVVPAAAVPAAVETPASRPAPEISPDRSVAGLVEDLGSADHARREAAGRRLEARWRESIDALRQAEAARDPEIRMRAREIAGRIRKTHRPRAYLERGQQANEEGRLDEALREVSTAVMLDPDSIAGYQALGEICEKQGRFQDALREYSRALKIDPQSIETFGARAGVLARLGRLDEAIADLTQAIGQEVWDGDLALMRAALWLRKGEADKAIADCVRVLADSPEHAGALACRAEALAKKGRFDEAVRDMRDAIANDGEVTEYLGRLAQYLLQSGQKDEADAIMKQFLAASEETASGLNDRAWMLCTAPDARLRDGPAAVSNAVAACEQTGWKTPEYIDTLAAAYAEIGDFTNAVIQQAKATRMIDEELRLQFQYRLDLYRAGKPYREDGSMEAWLEKKEAEAGRQEPASPP